MNVIDIVSNFTLMHYDYLKIVFIVAQLRRLRHTHIGWRSFLVIERPQDWLVIDGVSEEKLTQKAL